MGPAHRIYEGENRMRTFFIKAALFAAALTMTTARIDAQTKTTPEGLQYAINGQSVTITKYTGSAATLVIPSRIEGLAVTSLENEAFYGCESLTIVTIPSSVTSIGEQAFFGCRGLTSVTIPSSVIRIGKQAFSYCTGLRSVTIPSSVTIIGELTFMNCTNLTSVTIPNSVTTIEDGAFGGCTGLRSVTIPSSVIRIGKQAFSYTGLTSVTLSRRTQVENGAFPNGARLIYSD